MTPAEHIVGHTWHGRKGAVKNAFRYSVDYVLIDAEEEVAGPSLFKRNGSGVVALHDRDHGGPPGHGAGAAWAREVLKNYQIPQDGPLLLLAQPRVLGHVFNPVSFWLAHDAQHNLRAVIAEVTNTFGDRHSYLCHRANHGPIGPHDRVQARKIFHVSPFQPIEGDYAFRFDITDRRIGIWIDLTHSGGGVTATLTGRRAPMTNRGLLGMLLRRPFGSRRVLGLIHWQALKLWWKGASYRPRPLPPPEDVSR